MKKVFLTFALIFLANMASAQDSFKADALKVIELSGAAGPMQMAKEQILQSIPEAKKMEFSKDFDASLPALYAKLATIYMQTYSAEDVKAMLAFYESPVGKKISASAGDLFKKSTAPGQEWGADLQAMMMKYMQ
ncbi:DUF2059 domain-containing protein [Flavobacterium galactosidilyticum]|uniref:DUF2059 domain-containing protein n=1 Tax=Flavobacterium galactosidilyticum TaxID=2893886 RepID=UPI001E5BB4CF|nr:DUF2059 domain-containing protein [Flavobacterium sp. F-340]UFH46792.1 DUF2059 domain-containing protein [Flavobacterium sp. F-340]